MAITVTELKSRQAPGELTEADLSAVLDTKRRAVKAKRELGNLLTGRQRSVKSRHRSKPKAQRPDYHGLTGAWARYYNVASRYEGKIPDQDRDDFRHDCMLELERATERDGKPLPDLRAYRIASLMVALYYRGLNRFATRVCIVNGYPVEPHCKDCKRHTDSTRCAWLAIRPVERLDGEIIDSDGYKVRLIDTVASDKTEDMPEQWYDIKKLTEALPLRLVEIAYKKLEGKALTHGDRTYLWKWRKTEQKSLI